MTYLDYLRENALAIQRMAQRVRRRLWWSQLIRKITGGGEGHWKRYQSS